MGKFIFLLIWVALFYIGCSSGNPALYTLQMQSELAKSEAGKANLPKESVEYANSPLDSSRKSEEIGDDQLALVQAEISNLRYRVIFAVAEKEQTKKDSAFVEGELAKDKKRLDTYKAILEKEQKAKGK